MTTKAHPTILAVIREEECIGCTKCIQACPFDAIIGAHNLMHTVIADSCIGCKLCIPPCPVDCIDLIEMPEKTAEERHAMAAQSRERFKKRAARLKRIETEKREQYLRAKAMIKR
jgi:electron transport complex protein RnfB